jgi:hypothetical protein
MSDTSGRVSFGPTGKKIRREIQLRGSDPSKWEPSTASGVGAGAGTAPARKRAGAQMKIATSVGFVTESVWKKLDGEGLLKKVFLSSELVALLKRMATFIEIAASEGTDAVVNEFGVKEDAAFVWLQRKIRETAVVKEETDFAGAAHRAFQVGSSEWAAKLLGKRDPTKFKVRDLVEAVRHNVDEALVLSPDRTLLDYGKRVVAGAIGGGETNAKMAELGGQGFEWQHKSFMDQHNQAADWGSRAIPSTVKAYLSLLLA